MYLGTKFQVSSITFTNFRQGEGGNFTPPLHTPPQNEPLKSQGEEIEMVHWAKEITKRCGE